jgi:RNA polymerase sigma-70 factor, ECF subfamily
VLEVNEPSAGAYGHGDGDFESLYRLHHRQIIALAYALTGSPSAAEELAQEAFLTAYRAWGRISEYDDPAAWVRRVVVNRSVSAVRRTRAEGRALTRLHTRRTLSIELEPHDAEFWSQVRALPRRQAQVIVLHYIDDSSIDEIAMVLSIAPGTVKATLSQARRSLADSLGCELDDEL